MSASRRPSANCDSPTHHGGSDSQFDSRTGIEPAPGTGVAQRDSFPGPLTRSDLRGNMCSSPPCTVCARNPSLDSQRLPRWTRQVSPSAGHRPRRSVVRTVLDMATPRLLWTVNEATDILGLSRSTLYRLIDKGKITPIKVGASTRIPAQALERFVADELRSARGGRQ